MADRDDIYRWLAEKKFRWVPTNDPQRRVVERLVAERRAVCLSPNRYAAVPK